MSDVEKNPVLYKIDGIEIRKENKITIRYGEEEYKRLVTLHIQTGKILSLPKLIALLSQSCEKCGHDSINISFKKKAVSLSRSFTGGNITTQKSKNGRQNT